jgi:hypothetical protein
MANVVLSWPANPTEEEVTGYNVFQDGNSVGSTTTPGITVPDVAPGVHEFVVAPVNVWGQGPLSDPVKTPLACSKIPSVSISISINIAG